MSSLVMLVCLTGELIGAIAICKYAAPLGVAALFAVKLLFVITAQK